MFNQKVIILLSLLFLIGFSCSEKKSQKGKNLFVGKNIPTEDVNANKNSGADAKIAIEDETSRLSGDNPIFKILGLGTAQAQEKEASGELECPTGQLLYGITADGKLLCRDISQETKKPSKLNCVKAELRGSESYSTQSCQCSSLPYGGTYCTPASCSYSGQILYSTSISLPNTIYSNNAAVVQNITGKTGLKCVADYQLVDCSFFGTGGTSTIDETKGTCVFNEGSPGSSGPISLSVVCCKIDN